MTKRDELISEIKQKSFKVFNGQGFVELVDVMGSDQSVVQAARLTSQVSSPAEPKRAGEADRNLLRYLLRKYHTTPFEFAELAFKVRVPMDCWRQWIR